MDFPPVLTTSETDLPQAESLWKKIKFDLTQGFKVVNQKPHVNHIVRSYAMHPALGWQFLLIASANDTMPPVFSVELHVYPQGSITWKLNLKYQPLRKPHWQYNWKALKNMCETDDEVSANKQSEIINAYLLSAFDRETTKNAYNRVGYTDQKAKWMVEENLG